MGHFIRKMTLRLDAIKRFNLLYFTFGDCFGTLDIVRSLSKHIRGYIELLGDNKPL